jgi:hypothetical protein
LKPRILHDKPNGSDEKEPYFYLNINFFDKSDDKRIVPKAKLNKAVQEDQAVRKSGQFVRIKLQITEILQTANTVWKETFEVRNRFKLIK